MSKYSGGDGCGGILYHRFVANLLPSPSAKKSLKVGKYFGEVKGKSLVSCFLTDSVVLQFQESRRIGYYRHSALWFCSCSRRGDEATTGVGVFSSGCSSRGDTAITGIGV